MTERDSTGAFEAAIKLATIIVNRVDAPPINQAVPGNDSKVGKAKPSPPFGVTGLGGPNELHQIQACQTHRRGRILLAVDKTTRPGIYSKSGGSCAPEP